MQTAKIRFFTCRIDTISPVNKNTICATMMPFSQFTIYSIQFLSLDDQKKLEKPLIRFSQMEIQERMFMLATCPCSIHVQVATYLSQVAIFHIFIVNFQYQIIRKNLNILSLDFGGKKATKIFFLETLSVNWNTI